MDLARATTLRLLADLEDTKSTVNRIVADIVQRTPVPEKRETQQLLARLPQGVTETVATLETHLLGILEDQQRNIEHAVTETAVVEPYDTPPPPGWEHVPETFERSPSGRVPVAHDLNRPNSVYDQERVGDDDSWVPPSTLDPDSR